MYLPFRAPGEYIIFFWGVAPGLYVYPLNEFEKEILEAYENGKLNPLKSKVDYQSIARETMKKNRKINIRISENDFSALQRKAAREGIPYQTLIGSILQNMLAAF